MEANLTLDGPPRNPSKGLSQNKKRKPLNKVGKNHPNAQDNEAHGRPCTTHGWDALPCAASVLATRPCAVVHSCATLRPASVGSSKLRWTSVLS